MVTALGRDTRPWWISAVRRASWREDQSGIDIVVDTLDLGRVFLQVKSSRCGARQWRRRHRRDTRPIAVVIVRRQDDLSIVYGRALGVLILLRERVEQRRSR